MCVCMQVQASEQSAMVMVIREVDSCAARSAGRAPSEADQQLLGAAADKALAQYLSGPGAPQLTPSQPLSGCCRSSAAQPDPGIVTEAITDDLLYPTSTPMPDDDNAAVTATPAAPGETATPTPQTGQRQLLQEQEVSLASPCGESGSSCQIPFQTAGDGAPVVFSVQLSDRRQARLNLTGLVDDRSYEVAYVVEDRGAQCGARPAAGRPLFNRLPGSICFTTEPNCDPLVSVSRPEGHNCLELHVTFPDHDSCVNSETLHIMFGQPAADVDGSMVRAKGQMGRGSPFESIPPA